MSAVTQISRYWHTLRYLRPGQFVHRLRFRLMRPSPDLSPAPPLRVRSGRWVRAAERRASMTAPDRFRFLNQDHSLREWDDPALPKLWRYNLHYFDDLNADGAEHRCVWHEALMARWIAENPPAAGSGWEPYPTSLRIVNWVKYALAGHALTPAALDSLAVQARWLSRRIEWHLLGNHLFTNAKALIFAGCFFSGPEAEAWRRRGLAILDHEYSEQFCADGGHFERSPMYHALALEDVLDLMNLSRAYGGEIAEPRAGLVQTMREWLAAMTHPDGEIGFFNDAAIGIAPGPAALEAYAGRLGLPALAGAKHPVTDLLDSGYARIETGPLVALIDKAPLGPDYLPGHGHADTLSFELSLYGQRLLVNSGTSLYGESAERVRQRGTAAHNTVVIDGQDSSEVWSGFRVARRARVRNECIEVQGDGVRVAAEHDGYTRLPGRPVHRREWSFSAGGLKLVDTVSGTFASAVAHFHFHPAIRLTRDGDGFAASLPGGQTVRIGFAGGAPKLVESHWHPEFGLSLAKPELIVHLDRDTLTTTMSWSP